MHPIPIKKRILVLAGGNYISGTEKITLDIIAGLKQDGYDVYCMASGWNDGKYLGALSKLGVGYKLVKLGWYYLSNLKWSFDSLVNYPSSVIKFSRFIRKNKFDYVYTTSFRFIFLLYSLLVKNIIYHVHDPNSHSKQSRFFLKFIDKKVIKYIAVSAFIKEDLKKCGIAENKIEVIYNGTAIIELVKINNDRMPGRKFMIGIVGQIIKRKGHEDLIEALRILIAENLNVALIIVGRGDDMYKRQLNDLISKYHLNPYITFKNHAEAIIDIYKGIDVVVAPTRNEEPFGLIAIEANMLELPVIVSRKGGLVEIVVDGLNGFVVDARSPEQLAKKIKLLFDDNHLAEQLGKNGRRRVIEKFAKDRMISQVSTLFQ